MRKWVSRHWPSVSPSPRQCSASPTPPDEAEIAVHDHQPAMGTVVHSVQVVPARRVVTLHLDAGVAHGGELAVVEAAADPVEQHVHAHAGARTFGQRAGELLADRTRPVDIGLQRDRAPGRADGLQHRRKDLVAVEQGLDVIAGDQRRSHYCAHGPHELRIVDRKGVLQRRVDLLVAQAQIEDQQAEGQRDTRRYQRAGLAMFLIRAHDLVVTSPVKWNNEANPVMPACRSISSRTAAAPGHG